LFIFEHSSLGATATANGQCLLWEFTNLALDMMASFAQVKQLKKFFYLHALTF